MPKFIKGLDLAEGFYNEIVAPILAKEFPDLKYSAALMGDGSEVFGLDTAMSMDHGWGPRCQLFLDESHDEKFRQELHETLAKKLPYEYRGFSTNFSDANPKSGGTRVRENRTTGPVDHLVEITTLSEFSKKQLGLDATKPMSKSDWLAIPQPQLLSMIAGKVFRDDIGLTEMRKHLRWYPKGIWLFLMASTWRRIAQEERIVGRAGMAGDELGASLIAGRLVQDLMRLAFFMERKHPPYEKWFGTAFHTLDRAKALEPHLKQVIAATNWQERDKALIRAFVISAQHHNELKITKPMMEKCVRFLDRPFHVINANRYVKELFLQIRSKELVSRFNNEGLPGNIDLLSDNMGALSFARTRAQIPDINNLKQVAND